MSIDKVSSALQDFEKLEKKIKGFAEVLRDTPHADPKKKILWQEIYENAVLDRQNAHVLFVEAYTSMSQGTTEHAVLGATLSKYLERMNKANDQLIKLAEIMNKSESDSVQIDSDELFSKIQG